MFSRLFFLSFVGICAAQNGYIMTMPRVLRHGTDSEFCLTFYGEGGSSRNATLTFFGQEKGAEVLRVASSYKVGERECRQFPVPDAGEYDVLLSNSTDILHDMVKVYVHSPKQITFVQTDKPTYKPGQKVKFRIMTILSDSKPRIGEMKAIYVKNPNGIRVKQYLKVKSEGISSQEFQLTKEAILGDWRIEVILDDEEEKRGQKTVQTFTVKEYVLPRFEVTVTPPDVILSTDETISVQVCAKYTYGKPVKGFLDLSVCWGPNIDLSRCQMTTKEIDGCYNYTVTASTIKPPRDDQDGLRNYAMWYAFREELQVKAKVTEADTGVTVTKNSSGPGETAAPSGSSTVSLKLKLEDYSNGFFKPGLPYYGKVIVTKSNGSVGSGERIRVIAKDTENSLEFSKYMIANNKGVVIFSLCDHFTENSTEISIEARTMNIAEDDFSQDPYPFYPSDPWTYDMRRRRYEPGQRTSRVIKQWFSPSLSYIQIPKPDIANVCGERLTLNVAYTANAGDKPEFHYQVIARGVIHKTGKVQAGEDSSPRPDNPLDRMCLDSTPPSPPPPPGSETAETMQADSPPEIIEPPPISYHEPVERSEHTSDAASNFLLDIPIEPIMSPKFTMLVYRVREDGEIVADSMEFDVEPCFQNEVTMEFQESQVLPGQNSSLSLRAAAGSLCGVGVVDKSVNILGGDHQITPAKLFERIEQMQRVSNPFPFSISEYCQERLKKMNTDDSETTEEIYFYRSRYVDAFEAFESSGMLVLTDFTLKTRPCINDMSIFYDYYYKPMAVPLAGVNPRVRVPGPMAGPIPEGSSAPKSTVRSYFPETWLWDLEVIGPTGKSTRIEEAPHTITKWVGNAVCVHGQEGFGASEMTSLTTFQPFFLSIHLPYAAVRGERLPSMLSVYNYLDKCITVKVTLDLNETIKVHNGRQMRKARCICGGETSTFRIYITPKDIGTLPFVAKAEIVKSQCRKSVDVDLDYVGTSDEVHRKLLVKAEGVEQSYTMTSYMCSKDGGAVQDMLDLVLPTGKDIVRDSARGEVQVIGDIMGSALKNVNNLVRMPYGCGEQNMVGFVPNILVLDYLTSIGKLDEKTKAKAITFMEAGYQRELNYRHSDGSYSAFGENDPQGSVWLTAFVAKSFAQAQKYINIDEEDLNMSISFLRRKQLETGCFRETGEVLSSYMMGGLGKKRRGEEPMATLTAYVLVSLIRAGVNTSEPVIQLGLECMNREYKKRHRKMDAYSLALVAYANALHDPSNEDTIAVFKKLNSKVTSDASNMYWTREKKQPPATSTWYSTAAPSAEVEMTSYALMATLLYDTENPVETTHKIAMWLTRQRNPHGGFSSTQDTVVGLEALSQFASLAFSGEPADVQVRVASDGETKQNLDKVFTISDSQNTRLLLQTVPLPSLPIRLNVTATGVGCALVQANVRYNKPPKAYLNGEKPKFKLRVSARPYQHNRDMCNRRSINFVVAAKRSHKFSKGMGLLIVRMVTGWAPIPESITQLKSQFPKLGMQRIEHNEEEGLVTFYFDQFTRKAKQFILDVEQDKTLAVSKPKAAEAKILEYYETDVANVQSYKIKTTCGTKAEIPRRRPEVPAPGVQMRLEDTFSVGRVVQTRSSAPANVPRATGGCPICVTSNTLPDNLKALVCNSSAVYKALSGRSGQHSIKFRQSLKPVQKKVNMFASPVMEDGCDCLLLSTEGGSKRTLIVASQEVAAKRIVLDSKSAVMKPSKQTEKAVRDALKSCAPK